MTLPQSRSDFLRVAWHFSAGCSNIVRYFNAGHSVSGPTDAPPLVFLHPASYNRTLWLPQTDALQNEFRCVSVDLPAHGERAGQPFTFRAAVDAVREALDREQIGQAVLVGTSLGGFVSMSFAAQYPERVGGMVLSGCTFDATRPLAQSILTGESVVFPLGAGYFTRNLHRWLTLNLPPAQAQSIIASGTHWRGAAQAVRAMRGVDFPKRLSVFPGPVLIVNGTRDWVHRSAELSYQKAAQNARVCNIDGAGHVPNLDDPAAFTRVLREFAGEVSLHTQEALTRHSQSLAPPSPVGTGEG